MDTDGSEGTTPAPENRWDRFVKGFALGAAGLLLLWGVLAALVYWTSGDEYDEAASGSGLSNQTTTTGGPSETSPPGDVDGGAGVAESAGCTACHSTDGSDSVGPSWLGIAGTERPLEDGSSVLADSPYLLESIVDPNIKIVAGYASGLMPTTFGDTLSDEDLAALVIYIESLS